MPNQRAVHLLSASLSAAVDAEVIQVNPAARLKLTKGAQAQKRFVTRAEYDALFGQMPTERDQLVLAMLVHTGPRWGELAGLHWNRVDLERGMLKVVEVYDEKTGRMKAYLKGKATRDVPLPPTLVEQLAALPRGASPCPVPHTTGRCRSSLVLTTENGAVLRNVNWSNRVW